jgi:N-methylhydantoinase A
MLTGADIERVAPIRRLADMRYIGQGSEITVVLPDRIAGPKRAKTAAFEAFESYQALFAPHAAGRWRCAVRRTAPVGHRADAGLPEGCCRLELPRHASANALKGHAGRAFFPMKAGRTSDAGSGTAMRLRPA